MEPSDFLRPRIFLCKSSRYLAHLNEQMDINQDSPSTVVRDENFGSSKFQQTCDPADDVPDEVDESSNTDYENAEEGSGAGAPDDGNVTFADTGPPPELENDFIFSANEAEEEDDHQIIEARAMEVPIVVIIGLEKSSGKTEEENVFEFLNNQGRENIPEGSVKRAYRMPFDDNQVVVEMDNITNEKKILGKHLDNLELEINDHEVSIRAETYEDLWKKFESLIPVTKYLQISSSSGGSDNASKPSMASMDKEIFDNEGNDEDEMRSPSITEIISAPKR